MRAPRTGRPWRRAGGPPAPGRYTAVDWPTRVVGLCPVALLSALQAWDPGPVEAARLRVFDELQRWLPRQPAAESPVAVVDIDDPSLAELGQWPWPRELFGRLIADLADLGARAVAFDVLFAEPDRLSPPLYARLIEPSSPFVAELLRRMPSSEDGMAAAMRGRPVVLGAAGTAVPQRRLGAATGTPARVAWLGEAAKAALPAFPYSVAALPVLAGEARGVGLVTVLPELDGIVRRAPMLAVVGGTVVPGLALEAVRVAAGETTLVVRGDAGGLREVGVGGLAVPVERDGRLWLRFARRRPGIVVSAADVLAGRAAGDRLAGKIVFVGSSAAGLADLKVTPLASNVPGVEIQAEAAEAILRGAHLGRPPALVGIERAVVAAAGLALAWAGVLLPAGLLPVLLALALGLGAGLTWWGFAGHGLLVDGAYPAFAFAVLLFWLAMAKYIREEGRRRSLRTAFGHYLSPVMVDRLVASPRALALHGERRVLTVLFSDIRGFTALTEALADSPERLTGLLNRYFTAMTEVILESGGTIDKYIGDAIMAFWNAPVDDPEHARHGCLAALGMLRRLETLNVELATEHAAEDVPFRPLRIGIGLESGLCFVGNLGSRQRFNYSVIGDAVNVASRLEAQTKAHGFDVLVGEAVRAAAPDLGYVEVGRVQLKGKSAASRLHALVGDGPPTAEAA